MLHAEIGGDVGLWLFRWRAKHKKKPVDRADGQFAFEAAERGSRLVCLSQVVPFTPPK